MTTEKLSCKEILYRIVFESDTRSGRLFDVVLLWSIVCSVLVAVIDSLPDLPPRMTLGLGILEWSFTALFTAEYFLRIYISPRRWRYIFSFWGLVDLVAIFPAYLGLLFYGYQYLLVIRVLRLLRVFRILRLVRFHAEALSLMRALRASFYKISIFLSAVLALVTMLGTVMYVVEGSESGFTSIPQSMYWAIITLTTVGYGDIVPQTALGKLISSVAMLLGYAIIAVPTGIITVEMSRGRVGSTRACAECGSIIRRDARYCDECGTSQIKQDFL